MRGLVHEMHGGCRGARLRLLREMNVYKQFVWQGAFGSGSPKPTLIYSNHSKIAALGGKALPRDQEWSAKEMVTKCPSLWHTPRWFVEWARFGFIPAQVPNDEQQRRQRQLGLINNSNA